MDEGDLDRMYCAKRATPYLQVAVSMAYLKHGLNWRTLAATGFDRRLRMRVLWWGTPAGSHLTGYTRPMGPTAP